MWALALLPAVLELVLGYEVVSALAWEYVALGSVSALELELELELAAELCLGLGLGLDLQLYPGTPR